MAGQEYQDKNLFTSTRFFLVSRETAEAARGEVTAVPAPRFRQWAETHRVELLLFLLLWATFAYFYQSTQQNEAARFDQARAIGQDYTLQVSASFMRAPAWLKC